MRSAPVEGLETSLSSHLVDAHRAPGTPVLAGFGRSFTPLLFAIFSPLFGALALRLGATIETAGRA